MMPFTPIEIGLERAADFDLLLLAEREGRIVVSGDTDFGTFLAISGRTSPSVILFRSRKTLTADHQAELILNHLDDLTPDLSDGAVAVVPDERTGFADFLYFATPEHKHRWPARFRLFYRSPMHRNACR